MARYGVKQTFLSGSIWFLAFMLPAVSASAAVLQINTATWTSPSGTNTGTVGSSAVSANSNAWDPNPAGLLDLANIYNSSALIGSLAQPGAGPGDLFKLAFGVSSYTVTVTLNDALLDPIFVIGDLDILGSKVTVSPGGSVFTNNTDGSWSGNVFTTTANGLLAGVVGGWAAVKYAGLQPGGAVFTFVFDYSGLNFSLDNVALGLQVPDVTAIPLPAALSFFATGLAAVGCMGRRRKSKNA